MGSANGRQVDSESINLGSIPSPTTLRDSPPVFGEVASAIG